MSTDDLLEHFRLDAEVHDDRTIQKLHRRDQRRGIRETLEIPWTRTRRLGSGAFGEVWHEQSLEPDGTQNVRAMKIIDKHRMEALQIDFKKEILALSKFAKEEYQQIDVLVSFLGWFETTTSVHLAMEYFEQGDLSQYITKISSEREVAQITADILEGLRILHKEGFAHRDLKPQNIFVAAKPPVSNRWAVKIGDFGISKRATNDNTALRTQTGTPHFQAPEIQGFVNEDEETSVYSHAVDLWSLGCIVYKCSTGDVPFPRSHQLNRFCHNTSEFPSEPLKLNMTESGIEFVRSLLLPQPTERITVEQALANQWILDMSVVDSSSPKVDITAAATSAALPVDLDRSRDIVSPGPAKQSSPLDTSQVSSKLMVEETERKVASTPRPHLHWNKHITLDAHGERIHTIAFSPDGKLIVSASSQSIRFWDVALCTERDRLGRSPCSWTIIGFSTGGMVIASDTSENAISLRSWDMAKRQERDRREVHLDDELTAAALSPDNQLIATGSDLHAIYLWNVATGLEHDILVNSSDEPQAIAFSPDGKIIASGFEDKTIRLLDVESSGNRGILRGQSAIRVVAFSPDSLLVASGSKDGIVRLWNVATRQPRGILEGHKKPITSIAFSPDGSTLASGSKDRTVCLWDVATGQARSRLEGPNDWISSVAFSPDGKLIAAGSYDKRFYMWDLEAPASEIKELNPNPSKNPSKTRRVLKWFGSG